MSKIRVPVEGKPGLFRLVDPVAVASAPAKAVRSLPVCEHLGERLPGQPCGSTLRRCDLDGAVCSPASSCSAADRVCLSCTVRPAGDRPRGWQTTAAVKVAHQAAARQFLAGVGPYPEGRFSGRGVVIAGGGIYWPSTYVTVRMLRHVGCTLPVQVWYLGGRGERDERYERLLAPHGVECLDADATPERKGRRIVNGFEVKLFASLNSPFEEVLFLDADNYPCADPTPLFDEPRFREAGGVYWPDLPKTDAWTKWEFWGVPPRGPAVGLETGQYLLSKRRAWRQLRLAEWYDDHSDWCYGGGGFSDHGDKGPHRVAWAQAGADYAMYSTVAAWKGVAFLQPGPDGETPMFVHRCRSKFVLDGRRFATTPQSGANARAGLPLEAEAFAYLDELRRVLPPREV